MSAGLGTLKELKARLLPASQQAVTTWDANLTQIGLGVAAQFDRMTNRNLARLAQAESVFPANRVWAVLERYPVETVASVEQKDTEQDGYLSIGTTSILTLNEINGLVSFNGLLGPETSLLRVTYTGGYWFNTNESSIDAAPGGSWPLPDDLKEAWFEMCENIWDASDSLGLATVSNPDERSAVKKVEPSAWVKQILTTYRRYSII